MCVYTWELEIQLFSPYFHFNTFNRTKIPGIVKKNQRTTKIRSLREYVNVLGALNYTLAHIEQANASEQQLAVAKQLAAPQ